MSLIKRNPSLLRTIDPMFTDDLFSDFFAPSSRFFGGRTDISVPRIDIEESDKHYLVKADLPGVKKEDIDLAIDEGILTIRAHTEHEETEKKGTEFVRQERYRGEFLRRLSLGSNVSGDEVEANFEDGVLCIKIAKTDVKEPETHKIDIH